ncbi:MAG: hypothetical protein ACI8PB_005054 [Desulforhopalus sp.]|jgi:hypothetical protein
MEPYKESYKGCEILISKNDTLSINTKLIEYEFNASDNTWYSRYLPYSQYDSLLEMAKAIVSNAAEFATTPD